MELSRKALDTLLALVVLSEGAAVQHVRAPDGREYLVPDVVLHSDQGVYHPNGAQLPFRRGPRIYVLVRRIPIASKGLRLVLLDDRVRCARERFEELRARDLIVQAADGRGYALTPAGLAAAARARCDCSHPLHHHRADGCTTRDPATSAPERCPCPYAPRPVPVHVPAEAT